MPTTQASGSLTATGAEQILNGSSFTFPTYPSAVWQAYVNVNQMVANDVLELRVYLKVISADVITSSSALYTIISNAPTGNGDQVFMSMPVISDIEVRFTLKQTASGTGGFKTYSWSVKTIP